MALLLSQLYYNIGIFVVLRHYNPPCLTSKSRSLEVDLNRSATLIFQALLQVMPGGVWGPQGATPADWGSVVGGGVSSSRYHQASI